MKKERFRSAVWPLVFLTGLVTGVLLEHQVLSRLLPDDSQLAPPSGVPEPTP